MVIKLDKITQMRYGQMNELVDPIAQRRFDPSRVEMVSALRSNNIDRYVADVIEGKERWNAIVLSSTPQNYAHVASEFQRTYSAFERQDGEFTHHTYKIFIAELDSFKKLPDKFSRSDNPDAGLLNLCRTAIAPLGQGWGKIDHGTPVEVVFEDQERLRSPIIVDVHWNRRMPLEAGKTATWSAAAPRVTVPTNDNLKQAPSPVIEGCDNYFIPSRAGANKSRVLALGASFASGKQTWAGHERLNRKPSGNLDLDRVAKGSMLLAGGKKSILAHLQANVNSGCIKAEDYDSVIIFGGANGMTIRKEKQWEMGLKKLLTYVRDEMGIKNRYVVTLHGWYGWRDTRRKLADKDSGLPDDPSTPDVDESKEEVWASGWKEPKRKKVAEWTLKYNNDIIAAEGDLITGVLRWSKDATATNETGSEDIGEIIPIGEPGGPRDWFRKPWASSDGLHPSEAGHKEIARRLREMGIPGLK